MERVKTNEEYFQEIKKMMEYTDLLISIKTSQCKRMHQENVMQSGLPCDTTPKEHFSVVFGRSFVN